MRSEGRGRLAVIGIGNTIAGDDGAGIRVIELLERGLGGNRPPWVVLGLLEGDLLAVTELIGDNDSFIFTDAVAGSPPGRIVRSTAVQRAFAPSFHQTDIGTLMARLEAIGLRAPFPEWEVRGITIDPPTKLGEGLSPAVEAAACSLAQSLAREILAK